MLAAFYYLLTVFCAIARQNLLRKELLAKIVLLNTVVRYRLLIRVQLCHAHHADAFCDFPQEPPMPSFEDLAFAMFLGSGVSAEVFKVGYHDLRGALSTVTDSSRYVSRSDRSKMAARTQSKSPERCFAVNENGACAHKMHASLRI